MHSESLNVPTRNATLRVRAINDSGKPMLLVHGGPGGTDYLFKFMAKPLKDHGYRAIGFIQRGSPGSPAEPPFLIDDFIQDIEAIRTELGFDQIGLLGHSWGGLLSTLYAARYPHNVERLIVVCPIGARAGWQQEFEREIERRMSAQDLHTYRQLLRNALNATSKEERDALMVKRLNIAVYSYYAPAHRKGKPGLAHMEYRVRESILAQLERLYANPKWEEGLRRLECPSAVLYGTEDPVPAHVAQTYAEMLPGSKLIPLHDLGHFPWMEDFDDFLEALQFALE